MKCKFISGLINPCYEFGFGHEIRKNKEWVLLALSSDNNTLNKVYNYLHESFLFVEPIKKKIATLDTYQIGQLGIVKNVSSHPLVPKMTEMGIFAGQEIRVLYRAPFGDPIAVDMDGYVLSLRLSEARLIEMEGPSQ